MSHKGIEVKPDYIYRIRNRASPHLLLELQDGSSENNTQAWCWSERNDTRSFFNQLWLLSKVSVIDVQEDQQRTSGSKEAQEAGKRYRDQPEPGHAGVQEYEAWTLQNAWSGTFLDMENGSDDPEYGTKIRGWQGPPKGKTDLDQVWFLQVRSDLGYYPRVYLSSGNRLELDLKDGGKENGTIVWGWGPSIGNENQIWDFEQWSYTSSELLSNVGMKMPLKEDANVVKYTYPADPKYLILPYELYRAIWSRAIENKYEYTETLFDCNDFAFVFKDAVASFGYKWLSAANVGPVALLAGIVYGSREDPETHKRLAHAYNWSMGPNAAGENYWPFTENPWYFEPQTGGWDLSTDYEIYFVIF